MEVGDGREDVVGLLQAIAFLEEEDNRAVIVRDREEGIDILRAHQNEVRGWEFVMIGEEMGPLLFRGDQYAFFIELDVIHGSILWRKKKGWQYQKTDIIN